MQERKYAFVCGERRFFVKLILIKTEDFPDGVPMMHSFESRMEAESYADLVENSIIEFLKPIEKVRNELTNAYVKSEFELHDEKVVSGKLRAVILNMSEAAGVLKGTTGVGVKNHINKLAEKGLMDSIPK